ncbi:MAG: MBL fold metallo-hydrolase [Clostridia bacterium]|nr:MBL fold metallo-hydrolase [Clostridia bacterium]MBQ7913678.1 MBL fold metallo-hydrolase [Clostridia bacterium]
MKNTIKKLLTLFIAAAFVLSGAGCDLNGFINSLQSDIESAIQSGLEQETGADGDSSATDGDSSDTSGVGDIVTDGLSIHFLQLGNQYTGDCTLIDVGDTEVLIDAGSRKNSAATIKNYVDKYCEDGVLEYVIATHADQDHIAAFVGNSGSPLRTGILYQYQVGTLIQFNKTNKTELTDKGNQTVYGEYLSAVEYVKGKGTAVYTALECWNNENGASRSYTLGDGVTMQILYQKFYEESTSDENDYSVCMLLKQGENNYLFTGDLEKKGEASLVEKNDLPKCKLYKGGHHGSPTSSTDALLSVIKPEIVCVCCCAGSAEYTSTKENQFPSQAFIDRISLYTDKVYVTTMISEDGKSGIPMNGDVVVSCPDGKNITVEGTNNSVVLKDTEWFKANRTTPTDWQ